MSTRYHSKIECVASARRSKLENIDLRIRVHLGCEVSQSLCLIVSIIRYFYRIAEELNFFNEIMR